MKGKRQKGKGKIVVSLGDEGRWEMKVQFTITIPEWLDRILAQPVLWYRRRRYGYEFRRIRLTEGKYTIVEPEDYYRFGNYEWSAKGNKGHIYAVRFDNSGKSAKTLSLHREIMNAPRGLVVDHKNGESLDSRRENLRLATRSQNGCNSRIDKSKTSSRYRGVRYRKKAKRWVANIRNQGKKEWLGSFKSEIEAARAYDEAAKKYHGEFARLNFPELTVENTATQQLVS